MRTNIFTLCCFVVCFYSLVQIPAITSAYAQSNIIDASPVCRIQTTPLPQGEVIGSIKIQSTLAYMGPSVVCTIFSTLSKSDPFIVIGKANSTFGKPWYIVKGIGKNKLQGWVPAKYITLGKKYSPIPKHTTKIIKDTPIVSDVDLNVRGCPSTNCKRIGSLIKQQKYSATQKSSNGWYFINVNSQINGWVSGKFVVVQHQEPIKKDEVRVEVQPENTEPIKPRNIKPTKPVAVETFDPCKADNIRINEFKQKSIWRVETPIYISSAPHVQCQNITEIGIDKAIISLGELKDFYQLAYNDSNGAKVGYLHKEAFHNQYIPTEKLPDDFKNRYSYEYLNEAEIYWKTWQYKLSQIWVSINDYAYENRAKSILLVSLILGTLLLFTRRTRYMLYKADQFVLRSGYFMIRSPRFWRFLRFMLFWLCLIAASMFLLYLYFSWLIYIATYFDKIVGGSIFALFTISLGWFGVRVLCFFMALILTVFSFSQFVLLAYLTFLVFLIPSFLLMGIVYLRYTYLKARSRIKPRDNPSPDSENIESIHAKMFRFRNVFPETIINWIRTDRWKTVLAQAMGVIKARSRAFNRFFDFMSIKQ